MYKDDFVSLLKLAAHCVLATFVEYKPLNCMPDDLDLHALQRKKLSRDERVGIFEIRPQTKMMVGS